MARQPLNSDDRDTERAARELESRLKAMYLEREANRRAVSKKAVNLSTYFARLRAVARRPGQPVNVRAAHDLLRLSVPGMPARGTLHVDDREAYFAGLRAQIPPRTQPVDTPGTHEYRARQAELRALAQSRRC